MYGFPYRFQRAWTVLWSTRHPLDVVRVGAWNSLGVYTFGLRKKEPTYILPLFLVEILAQMISQFGSAISTGSTVRLSLLAIITPTLCISVKSNISPEVTGEDLTWFALATQFCFSEDHNVWFGVIYQVFQSTPLVRNAYTVNGRYLK